MNPASHCQFQNLDETAAACLAYWRPLKPHFSAGKGQVHLAKTGASFKRAAVGLEGFSRPLFGLAPLCAGGRDFPEREMFIEGLTNGSDPDHPDFWGWPGGLDQRLVESAALGFAISLAPEAFWDPLSGRAKDNLGAWLKHCQTCTVSANNWQFFHVLGSLGLSRVGVKHDLGVREHALQTLEGWYQGEGWYSDGANRRFDHYCGFAMHYYGLIYAALVPEDVERGKRIRERAVLFADQFRHWSDDEGAIIPYGRSMTYRFATSSFWTALAFAGVEAPSHGAAKKLWAANMRWWAKRDWADRDGVMSVGYLYPNLMLSESYNSPSSPYWAMKSFLALALPESHGFWKEDEQQQSLPKVIKLDRPGNLIMSEKGNAIMLSSGSECRHPFRAAQEKYAKFAYSSAYGFSVDCDHGAFAICPHDNALVFSENCWQFYQRSTNHDCRISDNLLWANWSPLSGLEIETWLIPANPWHIRIHKITSTRCLQTLEGGFAIQRDDIGPDVSEAGRGFARVVKGEHASAAIDLEFEGALSRTGIVRDALPNTSLYFPQTHVPQLSTRIEPGETWLAGAFLGSPNGLAEPPKAIPKDALGALLKGTRSVKGLKFTEAEFQRIVEEV